MKDKIINDKVEEKILDALGNELVIGDRYGYSRRSNGIVTIVVGRLQKIINDGRISVTLEVECRGGAVYDNNIASKKTGKISSPTPNTLFRLPNEYEVMWNKN